MKRLFESESIGDLERQIAEILKQQNIKTNIDAITCILRILAQNPELAPEYKSLPHDAKIILSWWLGKYYHSYSHRI